MVVFPQFGFPSSATLIFFRKEVCSASDILSLKMGSNGEIVSSLSATPTETSISIASLLRSETVPDIILNSTGPLNGAAFTTDTGCPLTNPISVIRFRNAPEPCICLITADSPA